MSVQTLDSEVVCDVTGGEGQWAPKEEFQEILEERVKDFNWVPVYSFDKHCTSGLYTLKYRLLDCMVNDHRTSETLSVFDRGPDQRFSSYIKHTYKRALQRRKAEKKESVKVLRRAYKRVLEYEEKSISGKLGRVYERYARTKQND